MAPIWMHIEHGTRPGCGMGTPKCEDYDEAFFPELIPEREADLIDLYYIQQKKQSEIAEIQTVTLSAVTHRLDRDLKCTRR
jgi:hypothetical protein